MRRLLITGSRDWDDEATIAAALSVAHRDLGGGDVTLVHGACPTGADQIADRLWRAWGLPVEPHPADWGRHGRAAGPLRNKEMVDAGADLCLAFPKGESRGTRGCLMLASLVGIGVRIFEG